MSKFKVGDKLRQVKAGNDSGEIGQITEIIAITPEGKYEANDSFWTENYLIENFELITNNKSNMSLTQKFINAFKPEPYMTFREKGITNSDDMLTEEGKDLYINWQFKKDAATFKTDVADKIVDETK